MLVLLRSTQDEALSLLLLLLLLVAVLAVMLPQGGWMEEDLVGEAGGEDVAGALSSRLTTGTTGSSANASASARGGFSDVPPGAAGQLPSAASAEMQASAVQAITLPHLG